MKLKVSVALSFAVWLCVLAAASATTFDSQRTIGTCGSRLIDNLWALCRQFGGIIEDRADKRSFYPKVYMPWLRNRWTRSTICDKRGRNPECLCCRAYKGPCSPAELVANFCKDVPTDFLKYVVND